jgi:hypothetical protein
MLHRAAALVALIVVASFALAQPSPETFLGHAVGETFTPQHRILEYFAELDRASDLVELRTIGESYEGRPLVLAVITSQRNHARLAEIQRNAEALATGQAGAVVDGMPAIVWLAFGVHGNESSSSEAAMVVAASLVGNAERKALLDDLVVVIDPLSNPDGRERYIGWYRQTVGTKANADPQAFEHLEAWPGGRFNHYLVDMNRDWAWMSQKETQARVAAYWQWHPQVYVDFHEMSHQSSYFFPPDAKPINANLPKDVERWLDLFGRANASAFTSRNWPFFVGEQFDLFYPGYGDSWPSLHGAIGMTYEMAGGGRAGLVVERQDGSMMTLADRVQRHAVAGIETINTAAANREGLLRYTRDAALSQIEKGKTTFLIAPDSPNAGALLSLLEKQRIRVEMLTEPVTLRATPVTRETGESRTFPAGTAVVSTRQPFGGLATTLLERTPVLSEAFVEEQRARADADEPDDFYDLTAWSLPLAMNVEAWSTSANVGRTTTYRPAAVPAPQAARYGYLVDGLDANAHRFAGRLLAADVHFRVAAGPLEAGTTTYSRGSIVILKGGNDDDLDAKLMAAARESGVKLVGLDSGWLGGTAFGSEKLRYIKEPRIALVGGPGTNPTSYGMLWHTLDVDTPVPHSTLVTDSLASVDLGKYNVLVFPHGNYGDRVGKPVVEKIRQWIHDGGTLVAVQGATAFLRQKDAAISSLKVWESGKGADEKEETPAEPRYHDYRVPGAAFRTSMNDRSYLTFGVPRPPAVLVEGSGAFLPLPKKVDNIVTIESTDPLITGVAWPENIDRLRGSVYVASEKVGRGQIVTFADDPHFRLFWRGTLPIFLNAVMYGPSFPR